QVHSLAPPKGHIGDEFPGVVSGIANFGIFIQLSTWLVEGLIRYEDLMDDWWDVDERSGIIRGERTGKKIGIGDVVKVVIVSVDLARRELSLAVSEHLGKPGGTAQLLTKTEKKKRQRKEKFKQQKPKARGQKQEKQRGGATRRNRASKRRGRRR